jgi:hypothetical protein
MHVEETLLYLKKYLMQIEVGNIKYINDGINGSIYLC